MYIKLAKVPLIAIEDADPAPDPETARPMLFKK
jgi:hypothetical protein